MQAAVARPWDEVVADLDGCIAWGMCPARIVRAEPRIAVATSSLRAWVFSTAANAPTFDLVLDDGSDAYFPSPGVLLRIRGVEPALTYRVVRSVEYDDRQMWLMEWPD